MIIIIKRITFMIIRMISMKGDGNVDNKHANRETTEKTITRIIIEYSLDKSIIMPRIIRINVLLMSKCR